MNNLNIIEDNKYAKTKFTKKEMCYFSMIDKRFKKCPEDMVVKMMDIIEGADNISLRILDWFVTRYAKKGVFYTKDGELYDIHINYKAQLKSYKKRYFDPFRRKDKFTYTFTINGESKDLLTTIGQLNFFDWAISNNIISYVALCLPQITKAMNLSNKEDKKKKALKIKKKVELSDSSSQSEKMDSTDSDSEALNKDDNDQKDDLTLSFD